MLLRMIIIDIFCLFYAGFEFIMFFRQKRTGAVLSSGDRGSLRLLFIMITVGFALSFPAAFVKLGLVHLGDAPLLAGALLACAGLIIRVSSIVTLKKYFTYSVTRLQKHELIETGLYKIIRHPGYLGQLIIFLGISVLLSNWLSVLGMMIPVLIGYLYRIKIEENFLVENFGSKYVEYQKRTKKLIPKIF